jgi:hypothetical protein
MNNKLNAIATFLRVVEAGSFSAAARQCGMKQSAVSQQIAALEEELGVVLLHRTTRAMALTEQGEITGAICSFCWKRCMKRKGAYSQPIASGKAGYTCSCRAAWGSSFCRICWRCRKCTPSCV